MEEPVSHQPQHQASDADRTRQLRNRYEVSYQLDAAEFISLDSDLQIFQRFNNLRMFVILRHQHRLAALTEKLENIKKKERNDISEGDFWSDSKLDIFTKEIESTLRDYDAAILAQVNVDKFSSPPQKFLNGFIRYCATKIPVLNVDLGLTNRRGDIRESLAAIAAREKSWTHRFIDQSKFLRTHLAKTVEHKSGWAVRTYSESAIRRAELIAVNTSFSLMLLCPIIILSFISSSIGRLVVVLVFLILGAILTSGIVTAANNSGLAVLSAYGAILIFFLSVK